MPKIGTISVEMPEYTMVDYDDNTLTLKLDPPIPLDGSVIFASIKRSAEISFGDGAIRHLVFFGDGGPAYRMPINYSGSYVAKIDADERWSWVQMIPPAE